MRYLSILSFTKKTFFNALVITSKKNNLETHVIVTDENGENE